MRGEDKTDRRVWVWFQLRRRVYGAIMGDLVAVCVTAMELDTRMKTVFPLLLLLLLSLLCGIILLWVCFVPFV